MRNHVKGTTMIFISYRIDDVNDVAARLDSSLSGEFGAKRVFRDKSGLDGGDCWPSKIGAAVRSCNVILVLIGSKWQSAQFADGAFQGFPRLYDPQDWVRKEITIALKANKTIIPLFVNGAKMPTPAWLKTVKLSRLAKAQGVLLRTDDYTADLAKLVFLLRSKCPTLGANKVARALSFPSLSPAPLALAASLQRAINQLDVSTTVQQSIHDVLSHPHYPQWMAVSDRLVKNPIWKNISVRNRKQLVADYPISEAAAPRVMHMDLFLVRGSDESGHGKLYTYSSREWGTYLFPFRLRLPQDERGQRCRLDARILGQHVFTEPTTIRVTPVPRKYVVSLKPDVATHDLKLYIFEFCAVSFTGTLDALQRSFAKSPRGNSEPGRWLYFREMRGDPRGSEVNGDVLLAIHDLFFSFEQLPISVPDGFRCGGDYPRQDNNETDNRLEP